MKDFVTALLQVFLALAAIALPISINVNESIRKRYKSSTLLTELEKISGVNPQTLNRHLFLIIAVCLIGISIPEFISLTKDDINHYFFWGIFFIFLWLSYIGYKTYFYFQSTYQLASFPLKIRDKLLASLCNQKNKKLSITEINSKVSTLMAIETNDLAHAYERREIDAKIKNLLFNALDNLEDPFNRCIVDAMLSSMPIMMNTVISVREEFIYSNIANLYLSV